METGPSTLGSSLDSGGGGVGIGNFKGIMLCNRPFAGSSGNFI